MSLSVAGYRAGIERQELAVVPPVPQNEGRLKAQKLDIQRKIKDCKAESHHFGLFWALQQVRKDRLIQQLTEINTTLQEISRENRVLIASQMPALEPQTEAVVQVAQAILPAAPVAAASSSAFSSSSSSSSTAIAATATTQLTETEQATYTQFIHDVLQVPYADKLGVLVQQEAQLAQFGPAGCDLYTQKIAAATQDWNPTQKKVLQLAADKAIEMYNAIGFDGKLTAEQKMRLTLIFKGIMAKNSNTINHYIEWNYS